MAVKTIEIDMDAYRRLEKARRTGESVSDTLRRVIWDPAPFEAVVKQFETDPISDDALAAVEQVVEARNKPARRGGRAR